MANIFLAEDDDSLRRFLTRGLQRAGHEVTDCAYGLSVLEVVESADGLRYDLLLADIVMPGMDGIELARRGGQRIPGLRVLFITSFAAVALRTQYSAAGSGPDPKMLSKPFHLRDLVAEVDRILTL